MVDNPDKPSGRYPHKRLGAIISASAVAIALAHLVWPDLKIDAITLTLLVTACVPWLAPIFKSVEFPGGWKVEFPELQKAEIRAENAGLLSASPTREPHEFLYQRIAQTDPNLALAGLRIEIEKRLTSLAEKRGIKVKGRGLTQILRALTENQVLNQDAASALADMLTLLNSAVHGASVDPRATEWAIDTGGRLLNSLDELSGENQK